LSYWKRNIDSMFDAAIHRAYSASSRVRRRRRLFENGALSWAVSIRMFLGAVQHNCISYSIFERHALDQLTCSDVHARPRTKTTIDIYENLVTPCEIGLGTGTLWAVVYMWSS